MIEAGIREKEKDVRNWNPYSNTSWIQPPNNLTNHGLNRDYKSEEVGFLKHCFNIVSTLFQYYFNII